MNCSPYKVMKKGSATTLYGTVALSFVIPGACDFFDLSVLSA